MSGHEIEWTFDYDTVSMQVICNEPDGADCRLQPADDSCQCEEFGGFGRDEGGAFHTVYDDETDDNTIKHRLAPGDFCNIVMFMDESDVPMEDGPETTFVIGRTAAEFEWNGDWYSWKQATS